jgi:hypothetical protein
MKKQQLFDNKAVMHKCNSPIFKNQFKIIIMKTTSILFRLATMMFVGLIFSSFVLLSKTNGNTMTKDEALKEIKEIKRNSDHSTRPIGQIEAFAKNSICNFENFVVYAKLAATVEYHTMMYVKLAEVTSKLSTENPLLKSVAEIVEIPNMGVDRFEKILAEALNAKTQEEKDNFNKKIEEMKQEKLN